MEQKVLAAARHQFRLDRSNKAGMTRRAMLLQASKIRGKTVPELIGPTFPAVASHVWEWFAENNACRGSNGYTPMPINHPEIQAWSFLTGKIPSPREVRILRLLDIAWLVENSSND